MHSNEKSALSSKAPPSPLPHGEERTATEARYRALFRRRRTGQSLRAFAATVGIPAGTLAWWQHELRRRDRERETEGVPTFLPVRVVARAGGPEHGECATGNYEVVLDRGRVIRVSPDFDPATLTTLVRAVEAASC